jgi:AcrR family transcriptional regulator
VKTKPIPEATRATILDAAWALIEEMGRLDVGQAEIAARAGVSRQTVYLAFGGRPGLLMAMLRRKDRKSPEAARLYAFAGRKVSSPAEFLNLVSAWIDYLPVIYPVGILLDSAALNDPAAARAWDDRMKRTLLEGFCIVLTQLRDAGHLRPAWTPEKAAEFVWSLVHPASWRMLVVQCGWTPVEFRRSRLDLARGVFVPAD